MIARQDVSFKKGDYHVGKQKQQIARGQSRLLQREQNRTTENCRGQSFQKRQACFFWHMPLQQRRLLTNHLFSVL